MSKKLNNFICQCGHPKKEHVNWNSWLCQTCVFTALHYDFMCDGFEPNNLKHLEYLYENKRFK